MATKNVIDKVIKNGVEYFFNGLPSGGTEGQVLTQTADGTPSWQNPSRGISMLPGSPNTIVYEWVGTQAQYEALGTYRNDTRYTVF